MKQKAKLFDKKNLFNLTTGLFLLLLGVTSFLVYRNMGLKEEIKTLSNQNMFLSSKPEVVETPISQTINFLDPSVENWKTFTSKNLGLSFRYPDEYDIKEEESQNQGYLISINGGNSTMVLGKRKKIVGPAGSSVNSTFEDVYINGNPLKILNSSFKREYWVDETDGKQGYRANIKTPDDIVWNLRVTYSFNNRTNETAFKTFDLILSTLQLIPS